MDELTNAEKVDIFLDSTNALIDELDMGVELTCSMLFLLAEKYWVMNRKPPFIEFMKACEEHIANRELSSDKTCF